MLNRGDLVRFCFDPWLNNVKLCERYPHFSLAQEVTFGQVVISNFNIPFRRRLTDELLNQWNNIKLYILQRLVSMEPDMVRWSLTGTKCFSTVSLYKSLESNFDGPNNRWI
jgi:hypothetical protein